MPIIGRRRVIQNCPGMYGAPATPPSITIANTATLAAVYGFAGTTYTFDDVAIGAADADRTVIFGVYPTEGAEVTGISINSGAITPTHILDSADGFMSVWMAEIPTGTIGDFAVTASGSINTIGLVAYRATGISASAPTGTAIATSEGNNPNPLELTLEVPTDGFAIVFASMGSAPSASNGGTLSSVTSGVYRFCAVEKNNLSGSQTFGVTQGTPFTYASLVGAAFGT